MQKGFAPILIVVLVAVLVGGYFVYSGKTGVSQKQVKPNPPIHVCTQDAKLCSDGTSVSRVPPNCDFAPCPSPKQSTSSAVYPAPSGAGDISNWKSYTNSAYHYKVKYPNDWTVQTGNGSSEDNRAFFSPRVDENGKPAIVTIRIVETSKFRSSDIQNYAPFDTKQIEKKGYFYIFIAHTYQEGVNASAATATETEAKNVMNAMISTFKPLP